MKILTFSTLYPNSVRQHHGIFVENRLRQLLETRQVQSRVVAPVPWFPFKFSWLGEYAKFSKIRKQEFRHGIEVIHPRYPLIPKFGMTLSPLMMATAMRPVLKNILAKGYDFDLIDAHYFYPDGVAAVILAYSLNKPVVITARGTDLNLIPKYQLPRRMIQWAALRCSAVITVCQALKDVLLEMGIPDQKITVLRNGVDLKLFKPTENRDALRKSLNISGITLISVGHLIKRKGHGLVIQSLVNLPDIHLLIVGDGPEEQALKALSQRLDVAGRVRFLGTISHDKLSSYYSAADILVLASSREGWANVLLESMACGTPVVATDVWGASEIVTARESGVLAKRRSVGELINAVKILLKLGINRSETRLYAEKFSWDNTTNGQLQLFSRILAGRQ